MTTKFLQPAAVLAGLALIVETYDTLFGMPDGTKVRLGEWEHSGVRSVIVFREDLAYDVAVAVELAKLERPGVRYRPRRALARDLWREWKRGPQTQAAYDALCVKIATLPFR